MGINLELLRTCRTETLTKSYLADAATQLLKERDELLHALDECLPLIEFATHTSGKLRKKYDIAFNAYRKIKQE